MIHDEVERRQMRIAAQGAYEALGKLVLGHNTEGFDYAKIALLDAAFSSARYFSEKFQKATSLADPAAIIDHAIGIASLDGLVCEFGVASGKTINRIASRANQTVYGFDSFLGLPEQWSPTYKRGAFKQSPPDVHSNVELIVGYFSETLPDFYANHAGPLRLLHVDCDLYTSTQTIFDKLGTWIVPGTVIVFDEYLNYPGWQAGEMKAFREFVLASGLKYDYLAFVPSHQQVSVLITGYI